MQVREVLIEWQLTDDHLPVAGLDSRIEILTTQPRSARSADTDTIGCVR